MLSSFFRKYHQRLAPIVFIQMLLWLVSGIFFSWNNFNRALNETEPPFLPMTTEEKHVSKFETEPNNLTIQTILDSLRIHNLPIEQIDNIKISNFLNHPIAIVQYHSEVKTYRYFLNPFKPFLGISQNEAEEVARVRAGSEAVVSSSIVKNDFDVFYPSFYSELPVFHVILQHPQQGQLDCYVSPRTGEILGGLNFKNRLNRILFSWFHIMEYSQSRDGRLWGYGLLMFFSFLMSASLLSGFSLYVNKKKDDNLNEK